MLETNKRTRRQERSTEKERREPLQSWLHLGVYVKMEDMERWTVISTSQSNKAAGSDVAVGAGRAGKFV